jgi:hypothetical protein
LRYIWLTILLALAALAAACVPGPPLEPPAGHPAHPAAAQAPAPPAAEDPYRYRLEPDPELPPGGEGVRWGRGMDHGSQGGHDMDHGGPNGGTAPAPQGRGGHGSMGHD